jgi:hypothetical protein
MIFIGDLRRLLFVKGNHKWNAYVRDITAWLEIHANWLVTSE